VKRLPAFILLFAFAAMFIEAVTLPADCSRKTVSKCTMMISAQHKCGMMTDMVKHHQQRKGKCNSRSCTDCPLLVVTTHKAVLSLVISRTFTKTEYAVMLNNDLSDYHSQQWKPPNTFSV
jgi:hypothetical protein